MKKISQDKKKSKATYVAIALVSLFIVCSLAIWRPAIASQLAQWKLLPKPEKLTELYFAKPNTLPSTYIPGRTQRLSFTVHNLEYQTVTYHYNIVEESQDGSKRQILASGSFVLRESQYQTVSYTGLLTDMGPRAQIIVELPTFHESINYWANRSNQ